MRFANHVAAGVALLNLLQLGIDRRDILFVMVELREVRSEAIVEPPDHCPHIGGRLGKISNHDAVEVLNGLADDAQVITIGSRMIAEGTQLEVTVADWKLPPATALVASEPDTGSASAD